MVQRYNNATGLYDAYLFDDLCEAWDSEEPEVRLGEGFYVDPLQARNWIRSFTVRGP